MARIKETELAAKLIAWLQSQGHKHLHEEVRVEGVGTADVVSCDGYITVYEVKVDKPDALTKQCERWLGLAHAVYAVSPETIMGKPRGLGHISIRHNNDPWICCIPHYQHAYNPEPLRSACNEHNAVGGAFAKAGSKYDKRATDANITMQQMSAWLAPDGRCTVGRAAIEFNMTPRNIIQAAKSGAIPKVAIENVHGKSYLVYNP